MEVNDVVAGVARVHCVEDDAGLVGFHGVYFQGWILERMGCEVGVAQLVVGAWHCE